jgi:hypothetical protein
MPPASTTDNKKTGNEPSAPIDVSTITARPAAGPLTPRGDPLAIPTTIPPTMPAIIPENNGAPEANAIPKHNGTATKKTTILAGRSLFSSLNMFFSSIISQNFVCNDSVFISRDSITISNLKNFIYF